MDILEAKGIVKVFPGVRALDDVDFDAHTGEIHALVGANGAGKSSLCKILAGIYSSTEGVITLNGEVLHIHDPLDAKNYGISMAPQEIDSALISYLSVAENIMLDITTRQTKPMVNWSELKQQASQLAKEVGLTAPISAHAYELSISERQKVAIAQALAAKAKFLILDEPTASLSLREVEELFGLIRSLVMKYELCVLYISHRMPEVFKIADRITVMRDGKKVGTVEPRNSSIDQVVFMMLNKQRSTILRIPRSNPPDENSSVILSANELKHGKMVDRISFELREREILAIAGLVGAGKTELARVLFGADHNESGQLTIGKRQVKLRHPSDAIKRGIYLVPEDRRLQGVLIDFSIIQNVTLPSLPEFCTFGLVHTGQEKKVAEQIIQKLDIKCEDYNQKVNYLSGGNQQKVSIGKWLVMPGTILMFDEPTKGVDVGAKDEIYKIIIGLADAGASVIYLSSELDEAFRISDRILVMYDGHIAANLDTNSTNEEEVLLYASGGGTK